LITNIIIIGGGLAGLINAILLSRGGLSVVLFEKKSYPFHRVCGEYISNEVVPFLKKNDLYPDHLDISNIENFTLTSTNGAKSDIKLDLGGFGISRYALDNFLYQKAEALGVDFRLNTAVDTVEYKENMFIVKYDKSEMLGKMVIGAHGKRALLDKKMKRGFMYRKSPYMGVKYHIKTDFATDTIALHNFKNGYCGISQVEGGIYNLCYLSHRDNMKIYDNIPEMQEAVLYTNPFLKSIFNNSEFLFEKPIVINGINFEHKKLVENHILMAGDAAGMIAPLCGNGMAMAIHSAKILSEIILEEWNNGDFNRKNIEQRYIRNWNKMFYFRLWTGRIIQSLFGAEFTSNLAVSLTKVKPLANAIVRLTHGDEF